MAKKISTKAQEGTQLFAEPVQIMSGSFTGDFTGPLYGNADTASSLKTPFTVSVIGDATGSFSTAGASTQLHLDVNYADLSDHANVADTALNTLSAQTATSSTHSTNAKFATEAGSATTAKTSEHATTADTASTAGRASLADYATRADSAPEADHAKKADHALEADHSIKADVATQLENPDTPVLYAKHADTADIATIAKYDCRGLAFDVYYALKSDLKDDWASISEMEGLFVPRKEQVLQATVKGKAFGHGFLNGNTLEIQIESLALSGDDTSNVYADIIHTDDFNPELADTTKVYIDAAGHMYVWNAEHGVGTAIGTWVEIKSNLDEATQERLDEALTNLEKAVLIEGDQTIRGNKVFENRVLAEIPTIHDDPRSVVTVHNLQDLYQQHLYDLKDLKYEFHEALDKVEDALTAVQAGEIRFAYKDYTVAQNQYEMMAGVTYIGLVDKDRNYIQLDPETNTPVDKNAEPAYRRLFMKASSGTVTWYDLPVVPDMNEYAKLSGADFTGRITVPYMDLEVHDKRVFNSADVHHLIENSALSVEASLKKYMPLAGGTFTGVVVYPLVNDLDTAIARNEILNAADIQKLIQRDAPVHIQFCETAPDIDDMEDGVLYSISDSTFMPDSEIQTMRVEPDDSTAMPIEGEGVIYVSQNLIS